MFEADGYLKTADGVAPKTERRQLPILRKKERKNPLKVEFEIKSANHLPPTLHSVRLSPCSAYNFRMWDSASRSSRYTLSSWCFFLSPEWKVRPRLEPNLPVCLQVKILSRGVEINDKAGPGLNFRRIRTASEDAPSLVYDGIWKRLL